ncbi:hypothetical protein [Vibrio viridaestus]|uniref:hypothetical protein n=1 Tax=Vibrio viridaestus TaxID=2487322 RepID=UPI0031333538
MGIRRLLLRPTTEYCAEVKIQMGLREKQYNNKQLITLNVRNSPYLISRIKS